MLSLLPIPRLLALVAISYTALIACAAFLVQLLLGTAPTPWAFLSLALSGGTALQLMLTLFFSVGWRPLWRLCPKLNDWLCPDLNGQWAMRIEWFSEPQDPKTAKKPRRSRAGAPPIKPTQGVVFAQATIVQTWLRMSIAVTSPDSDSQTLSIAVRKDPESQQVSLTYVFRVHPRAKPGPDGLPYRGAAILFHRDAPEGGLLKGKYWTERHTVGEYELRRCA